MLERSLVHRSLMRSPRSPVTLRRALALAFAGLFALAPGRAAAAAEPVTSDALVAELEAFVAAFNAAYGSNDLPRYWSFYAPEMTQLYPEGRLDLGDYKVYWEGHIGKGNRLTDVRVEDVVVHLGASGDAAATHYRIFTRTRHPDGSEAEEWAQETDVQFKRQGRWQVVHMHYSPAPKQPLPGSAKVGVIAEPASGAPTREAAANEVRAFADEFVRASADADASREWSFFAPGLTQFGPRGRLDAAEFRASSQAERTRGARVIESSLADLVVHLGPSNDAATAHYRRLTRSRLPDGVSDEAWSQESLVLFRQGSGWRIAHRHWSPAPSPP